MCLGGFLHLKPTAGCQISTLIFDFILWRGVSMLEVQKSTQALKSVKDPGNTFDLIPKIPKWSRPLPSLIYFSWDIYRDPPLHKTKSNKRYFPGL
jgi:hypothetical protein